MGEEIVGCPCGFKCVKSQLYKSVGKCPVCNFMLSKSIAADMGGK